MVHGAGSCSGGGGGGSSYSGGGFSTTVYSTNYYSSTRRNYNGSYHGHHNDCDCSCCKPFCLTCFCVSMKPRSRLKYLWFLITCFSLIIGLSVALGHYGKQYVDTSSSDMRYLSAGLSPRFCSGVEIISSNYPISAYLLPGKPVIQSGHLSRHTYNKYAALEGNSYEYWGFYLLKGSEVKISACADNNKIDYYFVKGPHNLEKWKDNNYCSSCYEIHKNTQVCRSGNSTFMHKIYASDEYYFIWANHQYFRSSVTVTFDLQRATYDLSSAIHSCNDSYCSLSFEDENSSESAIVVIPDVDTDNVGIHYSCIRRNEVFVGIFLIMPLGIGVIFSAIVYFVCIRRKSVQSNAPYTTLRNDATYNASSQYASFQPTPSAPPPSYSDQLQPPSYEESVANIQMKQ